MATFRRAVTPGATYFFTVNTYRGQVLLTDPPVYSALREALRPVKHGYVIRVADWPYSSFHRYVMHGPAMRKTMRGGMVRPFNRKHSARYTSWIWS